MSLPHHQHSKNPPRHFNCRCVVPQGPQGPQMFRVSMMPDPPKESWVWLRAGSAARHFSGQIFYRIRLDEGKT